MESEESEKALQELESSGEEVYKLIGQLLIKSDKTRVIEELKKKTGLLNLRIKNIEKQEQSLIEKLESLREDIAKTFNK